jgi:uncharacterized membrane protein YeaQ/YmgE (transglycosylase-associated protein family)
MFTLMWALSWIVCGLVAGLVAKAIYKADDGLQGFIPTVAIGIIGSVIGGGIKWAIYGGQYHHAGFLFSIIGGVLFCWAYRTYQLGRFIKRQQMHIADLEHKMRIANVDQTTDVQE